MYSVNYSTNRHHQCPRGRVVTNLNASLSNPTLHQPNSDITANMYRNLAAEFRLLLNLVLQTGRGRKPASLPEDSGLAKILGQFVLSRW